MPSSPLVLITSRSFDSGSLDLTRELQAMGARIVRGPSTHDLEVLEPLLAEAIAWIAGTGPVSAAHLDVAPSLQIVARYGVGVEAVDVEAAAARGVLVTNTPGANTGAVADHAIALMLAALRDVAQGDRGVRAGRWTVQRTHELSSLTVGIVGLGRIGRAVSARLSGFGSTVIGFDPWVAGPELERLGVEGVDLDTLARRADIISLHTPGEQVVVDVSFLKQVKSDLILVNTARATLVDESALAAALRDDRLRCYATDVLSSESGDGANPLLAADLGDRTVFTPHSAAQTVQAVDGMGRGAVDAVLAQLRGDQPPNLVPPHGGNR